jgi:hypothetical protein
MTAFRSLRESLGEARKATVDSVTVFLKDVGHGLLEVSHNGLAILGLLVVAGMMFAGTRPEMRETLEVHALGWLQSRQEARIEGSPEAFLASLTEPDAITRATAADPGELGAQQRQVAQWISRRYRVAPEPIARIVKEAWHIGERVGIDPTLILAIMAIESSFNPFAQSPVGAQGLMQVMTRVHDDKYEAFGGVHAAFDPLTNLRVGVKVLRECIARAGSVEGGLRYYVGAANLPHDGGYAAKVLSEQSHLQSVAAGRRVPVNAPHMLQAAEKEADNGAAGASKPTLTPTRATPPKPADQVAMVG